MSIPRAITIWMLLAGSAQANSWSDLWYSRDQQGQQALAGGDAKRAAELFADPRRQAYAQLQADQYPAAAKRLEPFADADSQYNRGNALAKSGDLPGALNAYDSALKHRDLDASLRRDAQHNRDLVAQQLTTQKNQQHPPSGEQPPQQGKEDAKSAGNESKGAAGSSSPPATQGAVNASPGENTKSQETKQSDSKPIAPSSRKGHATGADEPQQGNGEAQATKDQGAPLPQASREPTAKMQGNAERKESPAEQAAGSATEHLGARQPAIDDRSAPQTEQQLALEQWLRQIPDDPGGLLRRKFMIEHLIKQQQVPP